MKKIIAWTVKTRTGIIIPSWIFDNEPDAIEFCAEISERCRPQKHYVVKVEITVI